MNYIMKQKPYIPVCVISRCSISFRSFRKALSTVLCLISFKSIGHFSFLWLVLILPCFLGAWLSLTVRDIVLKNKFVGRV